MLDRPKAAPHWDDYDREFYHRVVRSRTHTELLACRKYATRVKDERVLRALVKAMFVSKLHQQEVGSCIRDYIGTRAIPALRWNLSSLRPEHRLAQTRLACRLGDTQSIYAFYCAVRELEPLDSNTRKSVADFLANYAAKLREGMRFALNGQDNGFLLFCSPYLHKYYQREVVERLKLVAQDSAAVSDHRARAVRLLASFDPPTAGAVLAEYGEHFTVEVLVSVLNLLESAEDAEAAVRTVIEAFAGQPDDRGFVAALYSTDTVPGGNRVYSWVKTQVELWLKSSGHEELPPLVATVGKRLCRSGHTGWVGDLETAAQGGRLQAFARQALVGLQHPAGLRVLAWEVEQADKPEALFRPCVDALRNYREEALQIIGHALDRGSPKLKARLDDLATRLWPGKTLDQLLAERCPAPLPAGEPPIADPQPAPPRTPRRRDRQTAVFDRNRGLVEEIKEMEQHTCQVCGRALVNARTGDPFAEVHHVHPLGHGGSDTADNLLCLCPLCHALFHLGCVGIDAQYRIHATGAASCESLGTVLRMACGRSLSRDALRYHWAAMFIPLESIVFELLGEDGL